MLFNFQLTPLDRVEPWGSEGSYSLHWYGLSVGNYWIEAGEDELLRSSDAILEYWARQGYPSESPYVEYQVARLWEDLLEALPRILEPVPSEVLRHVPHGLDGYRWSEHVEAVLMQGAEGINGNNDALELLSKAQHCFARGAIDTSYLSLGQEIWFWSDGPTIYLEWDDFDQTLADRQERRGDVGDISYEERAGADAIPLWSAQRGRITIPRQVFLDEVLSFHERFMRAMEERVRQVQLHPPPDVDIDIPYLVQQQSARSLWLDEALADVQSQKPSDWAAVLKLWECTSHGATFTIPSHLQPPDIEASITLFATDEGGPEQSVESGWCPNHEFGLWTFLFRAAHEYLDCTVLEPGDTALAYLRLLTPKYQNRQLYPGFRFTITVNGHTAAKGSSLPF